VGAGPGLTEERAKFLASRLLSVRAEVVARQEPEQGDSSWVLGCRAYEWTRYQLSLDAAGGQYPWLVALALANRQFDVRVGGFRFTFSAATRTTPTLDTLFVGRRSRFHSLTSMSQTPMARGQIFWRWRPTPMETGYRSSFSRQTRLERLGTSGSFPLTVNWSTRLLLV